MLKGYFADCELEAGCDEAGRGCLAGPVFAAAVIFPKKYKNRKLNDSKQLSADDRFTLRDIILKDAITYGVAEVSHTEIDEINILNASFLAMHRALDKLTLTPDHLIIDGNRFKEYGIIKHQCIIDGDAKRLSIAAASILAKTYRDDLMMKLHEEFPIYRWNTNKGYGTREHRAAIKEHGHCHHHRVSFRLLPIEQPEAEPEML